jgi:hypothetical protein
LTVDSKNPSEIREDDLVTFKCSATAHPDVTHFRWLLGNDTLSETGATLRRKLHRTHFGQNLTCEARNPVGVGRE